MRFISLPDRCSHDERKCSDTICLCLVTVIVIIITTFDVQDIRTVKQLVHFLAFILPGRWERASERNQLTAWKRREKVLSYLRNSPHFIEPEISLPYSQKPATCLYSEPDRSSSCPLHPTSWRSFLILSSHICLGVPCGLLPSGFPTKTLYATCPAFWFFFIWSSE